MNGDTSEVFFWAFCGCFVGWFVVWGVIVVVVKQSYPNAPPGSRAKRVIETIEFVQIIPLLPLVPIFLVWRLAVRQPLERWRQRRIGKQQAVKLRRQWHSARQQWAMDDLELVSHASQVRPQTLQDMEAILQKKARTRHHRLVVLSLLHILTTDIFSDLPCYELFVLR